MVHLLRSTKTTSSRITRNIMTSASNYVFFWKVSDEHGWASQWYPSPFTVDIYLRPAHQGPDSKSEGSELDSGVQEKVKVKANFPTAEHWMMTQKALLFEDDDVAWKVLAIEGGDSKACAKVKELGRKVKGFKEDVWVRERGEFIYIESHLKKGFLKQYFY